MDTSKIDNSTNTKTIEKRSKQDMKTLPVFVHSLWRSGSTYFFNVFRRSNTRYWCYQESIHEELLLRGSSNPDLLLESGKELGVQLRHPELDKPYYYELFETHSSWVNLVKKEFIYDEYFNNCSDALATFLKSLISAAKGRPLFQECRTSSRIGAIKNTVGGTHIYLWRNPWDQWWSFKCAEYFDVALQLVINASNHPVVIEKLRKEIGFTEFHDVDLVNETKYFEMRRLTSDDSYLVFFILWSLAWFEAQKNADLCINIDQATESVDYRNSILSSLSSLEIQGINLDDCNVHRATFIAQDEHFFQRNEDRALGILLSAGISRQDINALESARRTATPQQQKRVTAATKTENTVLIDAAQAREIVLRTETASVSRIRYLLWQWGQVASDKANLERENATIQSMLEEAKKNAAGIEKKLSSEWLERSTTIQNEAQVKLSEAIAREKDITNRLIASAENAQIRFAEIQKELTTEWLKEIKSIQTEVQNTIKESNILEKELSYQLASLTESTQSNLLKAQEETRKTLEEERYRASLREETLLAQYNKELNEIKTKLVESTKKEEEANNRFASFATSTQASLLNIQQETQKKLDEERYQTSLREEKLLAQYNGELVDIKTKLVESIKKEEEANNRFASLATSTQASLLSIQQETQKKLDEERHQASLREAELLARCDAELNKNQSKLLDIVTQKQTMIEQLMERNRSIEEASQREKEKVLVEQTRAEQVEKNLKEKINNLQGSLLSIHKEMESREGDIAEQVKEKQKLLVEMNRLNAEFAEIKQQYDKEKILAYSQKNEIDDLWAHIQALINSWPWKILCFFPRWNGSHLVKLQRDAKQHMALKGLMTSLETKTTPTHLLPIENPFKPDATNYKTLDIDSSLPRSGPTANINFLEINQMVNHVNELLDLQGSSFISCAYRTILGREPDPQGMRHYLMQLAKGCGKRGILFQLCQSPEAQKSISVAEMHGLNDEAFIDSIYRKVLGREADSEGKRHYLTLLQSGKSRKKIVSDIKKSPEAQQKGLSLPGLASLCAEERLANRWLIGRFTEGKRILREVNRFGYDLENAKKQLSLQIQQNQMQTESQVDRICEELKKIQQTKHIIDTRAVINTIQIDKKDGALNGVGTMPKILHRVYFENYAPYYDPFLHYLETWRRELPQYEIMKWGGDNVNVSSNEWLRRSAEANDPVFLSEFVRWDALKKYGGIYLDSDCEVLNGEKFDSLVEELMNSTEYDAFVGVEEFYNGHPTAQTIAAKKGAALVDFMHKMYQETLSGPLWHWRAERGLIGPQLISLYFREHGLTESKGFPIQLKEPIIIGRVKIYPQDYFSPKFTTTGKKLAVSENTCIYHLFANQNVKDVDPEAEKHRKNPLLFNEYCQYLANLNSEGAEGQPGNSLINKSAPKKSGIRKLHRIYFGFDGKPDPYRRYLDTWVKQMPGYEICHWNTTNLPLENCQFSKMMYEFKDHAFLSDYFRWWVLREHGGIYLDADIEITNGKLLNQLVEELEQNDAIHSFIGIDSKADGWYTGHSMACKKGSPLATFMCEVYEGMGHVSMWRRKIFYFMAPQLTSLYFAKHGWNVDGMGSTPNLDAPKVCEGVKIYPQDWFSPMKPVMKNGVGGFEIDSYTENTCVCHHFSCSWHSDDSPYKKNGNRGVLLLEELLAGMN